MNIRNMLLLSLLGALAACQPETTPPETHAAPPVEVVSAPATPLESAVPAQSEVPVEPIAAIEAAAPVAMEKVAAPPPSATVKAAPKAKPAIEAKPATPVPPAVVASPPEVKPEVKASAVMPEAEALALAKKSGCLVCHAVDKKVVGPAWKDVAAKYRGDKGAEAMLTSKIGKGGSGVWGSMAMPPQSRVSEADRQVLARFVLSLK